MTINHEKKLIFIHNRHLNKKIVKNINRMGIEGYWAPLRLWIEE